MNVPDSVLAPWVFVALVNVFTSVYVNEVAEVPVIVNCSRCKNDEYAEGTVRTSTPVLDTTRSNPNRSSFPLLVALVDTAGSGDSELRLSTAVNKVPCKDSGKPKLLPSLCI